MALPCTSHEADNAGLEQLERTPETIGSHILFGSFGRKLIALIDLLVSYSTRPILFSTKRTD